MAIGKKTAKDTFANIAYLTVTESAQGTLTFKQLQMASNMVSEKFAVIIHRAEVFLSAITALNTSADTVDVALTVSDRITDIADLSQPEMLFFQRITRVDIGTAASGILWKEPAERDFTTLPGGGILVPADRLYVGIKDTGASGAMAAYMRLYYTVMSLTTEDYWQLIEARRVMTT